MAETLNNRIYSERKSQRMSQNELAKKSDVSRATVSGLESGRISVTTTSTLIKISNALGKTVSEIFFA